MTIPSSGTLKLADIQTEFGGSNPISISEYYAGGSNVPSGATGTNGAVPTSGQISFSSFYGTTKGYVFNDTISSDIYNYNLYDKAIVGGWNGSLPLIAHVIIASGKIVGSHSTANAAFKILSLPGGSTVYLENDGYIVGKGGDGSTTDSGVPGGDGGTALLTSSAVSIDNTNGTIGGGGGGGGSSFSFHDHSDPDSPIDQAGDFGGGGAGQDVGSQSAFLASYNPTLTTGGAGSRGDLTSGNKGGSLGAAGTAGDPLTDHSPAFTSGGAGGNAVDGSSHVSWIANGSRLGGLIN